MNLSRLLDFVVGVPLILLLSLFKTKKSRHLTPPKKILLIKFAAAGDTLLLLPVIREFRKLHPAVEIDWLVSSVNADLASLSNSVDRFLVWDKKIGLSLARLIRQLRVRKYDVAIDLEQWSRGSAILAFLTGAPVCLGFDSPGQYRSFVFTKCVRKQYEDHEINDFVRVLGLLGHFPFLKDFKVEVPKEGRDELESQFHLLKINAKNKNAIWVVAHPGCGHDGLPREWPLVSYATLLHWVIKEYHATVFITAGPEEIHKAVQLNRLLNGQGVNLAGKLRWRSLMALIDHSDLVISGNTGVMHVAAALQKKQVALHGPTNPLIWGPLNPRAKVVTTTCPDCPSLKLGFEYHTYDQSCMRRIQVENVKEAIQSLMIN